MSLQNPPDGTRDVFAKWGDIWHTAFYQYNAWSVYNRSESGAGFFQTILTPPDQWIELDTLNAPETDDAPIKAILDRIDAVERVIRTLPATPENYVSFNVFNAATNEIHRQFTALKQRIEALETRPAPPEPVLTMDEMRERIGAWYNYTNRRDMSIRRSSWFLADPDAGWHASGIVNLMDDAIRAAYAALIERFPEVAQS